MMSDQNSKLILRSSTLADGRVVDVSIEDEVITAIATSPATRAADTRGETSTVLDLSGYMLLPSPVEPHAHLDKALIADRVPNLTGDLGGAIEAIQDAYESMTMDDISVRALNALTEALAHGYSAVRTHVDCREGVGTRGVHVLVALRERLRGLIDLQIVALSHDVVGPTSREGRRLLVESMNAGVDFVGGCPAIEPEPTNSLREFLAISLDFGRGMDLHVDETTDKHSEYLRQLAEMVLDTGFALPVTASHCVSLGMQDEATAADTARLLAEAGIGVVTLPQTNLFLQGRDFASGKPRGLTAIDALLSAGVVVAGGSDNWRDPFNPMGRIDAMETASLMVSAGHLMPSDAYASVSARARAVMGLPAVEIKNGYPADLLAIKGSSLDDAIARASEERIAIKAGRIVARTTVTSEFPTAPSVAAGPIPV